MKSPKNEPSKKAVKAASKSPREDATILVDRECERLVALIPEMKKRLEKAKKGFGSMQQKAMTAATRFEWSKTPRYAPCPLNLERGGRKPGRQLKTEPDDKDGMYRYGFSEERRVVSEECYRGNSAIGNATFWEYDGEKVNTAYFDSSKSAVNVTSTFYKDGYPTGFIVYALMGLSVEVYETQSGLITKAHRWSKEHDSLRGRDKFEALYTDEIAYTCGELSEIVRAWATGERETTFTQKKKEAKLDLKQDFADIYSYLSKRVKGFKSAGHKGPGKPGEVQRIQLGYECAQAGWVAVVFDTRPEAKPDGQWTLHIEGNHLAMPHWKSLSLENEEEAIKVVRLDGTERSLGRNTDFAELIGDMLKSALLEAREESLFETLPMSAECVMDIEGEEAGYSEYGIPVVESEQKKTRKPAAPKLPATRARKSAK